MKNMRMSKKNPSKILKIIQPPHSHRYSSPHDPQLTHSHLQSFAITSSRQRKPTAHESTPHSPTRSQRLIEFTSLERTKKIRSKSLNRSEEEIKTQDKDSIKLVMRQRIENRSPRYQCSPYMRRGKLRDSQKFLNFNSVSLSDRRKEGRDSKQILKSTSRRKHTLLKIESHQESDSQKKEEQGVIESAKRLLNNGEYRKSLLVLKSVLKNKPEHSEGMYLSAVNWFHLEDRQRAHYYTEQLIRTHPTFSPEIYKIKAVCYFKTLEYSKSLLNLKKCHELFPDEPESYELEGKIFVKMMRWKDAISSYQKYYDLTGNTQSLGLLANCHEELHHLSAALECYSMILQQKPFSPKYILRKMRLHYKLSQFQDVIQTMQAIKDIDKILQMSREKDEIYYLCSYAHYKNKKYSSALILIDQGLRTCQHEGLITKFQKLLLMIKIIERDIYEAHHLIDRLQDVAELRVLRRFVEGVISLMRRNHNEGIIVLLSIQGDLGFQLDAASRLSSDTPSRLDVRQTNKEIKDEFLNELRKSYLLFLSYGYLIIGEFHSSMRLMEVQKEIGVPSYFQLGLSYNNEICLGIILHCDRQFKQAESHFIKAKAIYQNKLEPPFSLALNYLQLMVNAQSELQKQEMVEEAKGQFAACKKIIGRSPSNTAAGLYYFNSLLHGYLQEWKQALMSIDESIDRSQDHYWRYFYIRGMLLSCIHSFKQAVNDLTIAINLSGNTKPQCYLLRSKCLQIEGEGNQAFKDLQQYISLKPDDPQVHKYAGQLLFQNGAFQDALTAFSHQKIVEDLSNYDIFLTQGKSFFLLGRFSEAISSIQKAYTLQPCPEVEFDIKVLRFLDLLTTKKNPIEARNQLDSIYGKFQLFGRIFKFSDYHLLKATCFTIEQNYSEAIQQFKKTIKEKLSEIKGSDEEDQSGQVQNKKQVDSFTNQMRYNIILCHLNLDQNEEAINLLNQIKVDIDQPFYGEFVTFKKWVKGQIQFFKKQEVFPSRNKLSNFLQKIEVSHQTQSLALKLCVPFPKVEPPQIFPSFDKGLLQRLSVLNVERKPEAPWILRETNSIRFTQKMEVFSRLQLQDSESESASTYQMISVDQSHIEHSSRPGPTPRLKTNSQNLKSKPKLIE